jgi:hypothetical protein
MDIAALVAWVVTALGGFVLVARWVSRGGLRQQQTGTTRFPAPVVFGHFVLAAVGLVLWIIYLVTDTDSFAWTAFGLLVAVALLGFGLLSRWIPVYRSPVTGDEEAAPAERHLPVPVVVGHGVWAATTLVLVLLAALGLGVS